MIKISFPENLLKFFSLTALLLLLVNLPTADAQQLKAGFAVGNGQYNAETFWLQEQPILLNERYISFMNSGRQVSGFLAYGLAPDYTSIALLERGLNVLHLTARGDTLNSFDVSGLKGTDPSLAVYPQADGTVMVRKNIAGFSQFDVFGNEQFFVSNSSQSQGGESISEVAVTADGRVTLLYNPKIMRDGTAGSAARIIEADGTERSIFYDGDRTIASADIAEGGTAVALLTRGEGSNDQVKIMDRFGQTIQTIETEEDLVNIALSPAGDYVTIWARARVQVYRTTDGERLGSTSTRRTVAWAEYAPDDEVVVCLLGQYREGGGKVADAEIQAVHFGRREIADADLDETVGMSSKIPIRLERSGRYQYQIKGLHRPVDVSIDF